MFLMVSILEYKRGTWFVWNKERLWYLILVSKHLCQNLFEKCSNIVTCEKNGLSWLDIYCFKNQTEKQLLNTHIGFEYNLSFYVFSIRKIIKSN